MTAELQTLLSDNHYSRAPSLADSDTSTRKYSRADLLSFAKTPHLPVPVRLDSCDLIRRSTEWIDEQTTLLDGLPVSKALPVPIHRPQIPESRDTLFSFQSRPSPVNEQAAPIKINFHNPDPFRGAKEKDFAPAKASSVFQTFPSAGSSSIAPAVGLALSLGDKYSSLRRSSDARSRTPSFSSTASSLSSTSVSISGGLNRFAAPFPLPATTPEVAKGVTASVEVPSLPLPKILPASVPPKPSGPVAPVFVKRESATLPQPMSLPDVAPLGKDWEGENAMSGNEKRRRASGIASTSTLIERRPERLVRLGARLRESVSSQERAVKICQ